MIQGDNSINIFTVKNVSWAPDLGHNLLSTIPLAIKGVEVFMRQAGVATRIIHENKIHGLADIIDRQYVLRIKTPEVMIQTNFANTKTSGECDQTNHRDMAPKNGPSWLSKRPQTSTNS